MGNYGLIWRIGCSLLLASCSGSERSGTQSSRTSVGIETNGSSAVSTNQPQKPSGKCLQLVNGLATEDYPAVVRLMSRRDGAVGICTGTFISPTAVITAAHCIDSSANGGLYLVGDERIAFTGNPLANAISATRAFTNGATGSMGDPNDPSSVSLDTAILLFPKGIAKTYMGISNKKSPVGTKVTSVGYGLTNYFDETPSPNYDATKHYGLTAVISGDESTNIYVGDFTAEASEMELGARVVESSGDSGGPLIADDMLIGTLSVGGAQNNENNEKSYYSAFVDMNSAATRALINKANAGGAAIPQPGTEPQVLKTTTTTNICGN